MSEFEARALLTTMTVMMTITMTMMATKTITIAKDNDDAL